MRGTESLFGHHRRRPEQRVHWDVRPIASGAAPKAPQAPEADRVIAGYVQIHSVLTARSDKFA